MWHKAMDKLKEETERRKKDLEKKHKIEDNSSADRFSLKKEREHKTGEFNNIDLGLPGK
jgi:hypothetical protein